MKPESFPQVCAALTERGLERFVRQLALAEDGLRAGAIANPVFQDLKTVLGRSVEEGWRKCLDGLRPEQGGWLTFPNEWQDVWWQHLSSLNAVKSAINKVNKAEKVWEKGAALRAETMSPEALQALNAQVDTVVAGVRYFLAEVKPIADAVESLKDKVVKRQPKAPEEAVDIKTYVPPDASAEVSATVRGLLEDITRTQRDNLVNYFLNRRQKVVKRFLEEDAKRGERELLNYSKLGMSMSDITHYCEREMPGRQYSRYRLLEGAAELMQAHSEKDADEVQAAFVFKNLKKLCSIVEGKGNLATAEVVGCPVDLGSLQGELKFMFTDGAAFYARNSAVISTSVHGKLFMRYPLTFHDVVLPGGEKMKQPSEEKMNTVFAGRYYGTVKAPPAEQIMLESLGVKLGPYDEKRGEFMVEASHAAHERLMAFSADFEPVLYLRPANMPETPSADDIKAEAAWYRFRGLPVPEQAPVTAATTPSVMRQDNDGPEPM